MGFGVWGLGFGVWGLGFRVWGLGFFLLWRNHIYYKGDIGIMIFLKGSLQQIVIIGFVRAGGSWGGYLENLGKLRESWGVVGSIREYMDYIPPL